MNCPSCGRPIAMARPTCVYCGGALSVELLETAAAAAQRVLQSASLVSLEAAAKGLSAEQTRRRYLVIDTQDVSVESLAASCAISVWEARQWRSASRYRLLKVTSESPDGPLEQKLREGGLKFLSFDEDVVARGRSPLVLDSVDSEGASLRCSFRADANGPSRRGELKREDIALILSATIRREKVKETSTRHAQADTRLEDAWLIHLHVKGEPRPFELDPRRTTFEGLGSASAHMRSLELLRRLAAEAPHDDSFKNVVPALSPGVDPLIDLASLKSEAKSGKKDQKLVVLDNVAQFREYSAWRGAVEKQVLEGSAGRS